MLRRWLFPSILIGVALLGAGAFIVWGPALARKVDPETFKVLAQLVLIVGLGGVGSLVLDELNYAREQRQRFIVHSRKTFTDIVASYNKVKSIRRRLRAEAIRPSCDSPVATVRSREYAMLLRSLNDAQLTIEAYVRLIEANGALYRESGTLTVHLEKAEKYLGGLVSEWEKRLGNFQGEPPSQPLSSLPVLKAFVADAETDFKSSFSVPVTAALGVLSRTIRE
jgi:hypothetical protein